jgi:hypothetical protein
MSSLIVGTVVITASSIGVPGATLTELTSFSKPIGQFDLTDTIPEDWTLGGVEADLQCIELDPGASRRMSFTPGLALVLGG